MARHPMDPAQYVALIMALGVSAYRLSISWPRVLPDGTGAINERGLACYDRLIDTLLAQDITPHVTLFHWDSPQALEGRYGSWRPRRMAQDFADYASVSPLVVVGQFQVVMGVCQAIGAVLHRRRDAAPQRQAVGPLVHRVRAGQPSGVGHRLRPGLNGSQSRCRPGAIDRVGGNAHAEASYSLAGMRIPI
jgi:hypothetical protein